MGNLGIVDVSGTSPWDVNFLTKGGDLGLLVASAGSVIEVHKGAGRPEVQKVTTAGTHGTGQLGGTFTVSFAGFTTGNIAYNADAATMKAALRVACSNAYNFDVYRFELDGTKKTYDWFIVFTHGFPGQLADFPGDLATITTDHASLTQASGAASTSVTTLVDGELSHAAGGLTEGSAYRFKIKATNAIGTSLESPTRSLRAATAPLTVAKPSITDVTPTSIGISWAPSASTNGDGGSPYTGFKVYSFPNVAQASLADPNPVKEEIQTIATTATSGTLTGDFRVSFRGSQTPHIKVDASAADVERALENLNTVGDVSVSLTPGSNGGNSWAVTFHTEVGDLPKMQVTAGRLIGTGKGIGVTESFAGSSATLVYDGSQLPNTQARTISGLTTGSTYAFKVSQMNIVGQGVAGVATDTVVARAGASGDHTTASGSALAQGITGVVYEVQTVSVSGSGTLTGGFTLKLGSNGDTSSTIAHDSNSTQLEAILEGLQYASNTATISDVHVSRTDSTNTSFTGFTYSVTFVGNTGDVPELVPALNTLNDGSGSAQVNVAEFIKGRANQFTIEPKKVSGAVVKDITAAVTGADVFFTELWTSGKVRERKGDGGAESREERERERERERKRERMRERNRDQNVKLTLPNPTKLHPSPPPDRLQWNSGLGLGPGCGHVQPCEVRETTCHRDLGWRSSQRIVHSNPRHDLEALWSEPDDGLDSRCLVRAHGQDGARKVQQYRHRPCFEDRGHKQRLHLDCHVCQRPRRHASDDDWRLCQWRLRRSHDRPERCHRDPGHRERL